jgi:hypothetical protein
MTQGLRLDHGLRTALDLEGLQDRAHVQLRGAHAQTAAAREARRASRACSARETTTIGTCGWRTCRRRSVS